MQSRVRFILWCGGVAGMIAAGGCGAFRAVFDEPTREHAGETAVREADAREPEKVKKTAEKTPKGPSSLTESELTPRERELMREKMSEARLPERPLDERIKKDNQNRNWVFGY